MRQGWGLAFVIVVGSVGVWAACVGDDLKTSDARGGPDQLCFENGSCLGTLACVRGLCVPAAEGGASSGAASSTASSGGASSTSSSSGAPEDASGSSSSSGNPLVNGAKECGLITASPQATCPTPKDLRDDTTCEVTMPWCCAGIGCTRTQAECGPSASAFECFATSQCGGGNTCCLHATATTVRVCGGLPLLEAAPSGEGSTCQAACDGAEGEIELCDPNNLAPGARGSCKSGERCETVGLDIPVGADTYRRKVGRCVPSG